MRCAASPCAPRARCADAAEREALLGAIEAGFGDLERFNEALRAGALRLVLERARVEIAVFAAGRDERRGGESPRRDVAAASWVPSPFHSPSSVGFRCEAKHEVQL